MECFSFQKFFIVKHITVGKDLWTVQEFPTLHVSLFNTLNKPMNKWCTVTLKNIHTEMYRGSKRMSEVKYCILCSCSRFPLWSCFQPGWPAFIYLFGRSMSSIAARSFCLALLLMWEPRQTLTRLASCFMEYSCSNTNSMKEQIHFTVVKTFTHKSKFYINSAIICCF